MTSRDSFSVRLKCPSCGKVGTAKLSKPDGYSYLHDRAKKVDFLAEGFHVVSGDGGDISLYCSRCNVPAKA